MNLEREYGQTELNGRRKHKNVSYSAELILVMGLYENYGYVRLIRSLPTSIQLYNEYPKTLSL